MKKRRREGGRERESEEVKEGGQKGERVKKGRREGGRKGERE